MATNVSSVNSSTRTDEHNIVSVFNHGKAGEGSSNADECAKNPLARAAHNNKKYPAMPVLNFC